jgi:hypothetical protein
MKVVGLKDIPTMATNTSTTTPPASQSGNYRNPRSRLSRITQSRISQSQITRSRDKILPELIMQTVGRILSMVKTQMETETGMLKAQVMVTSILQCLFRNYLR